MHAHTIVITNRSHHKDDITDTFPTLGDAWNAVLSFLTHPSNGGMDQYDRGYVNAMKDARYTGTIYTQKYGITVQPA